MEFTNMVQYKGYISLEYGKVSSISSTHPENPTNLLNWRFKLVTDRNIYCATHHLQYVLLFLTTKHGQFNMQYYFSWQLHP